jgi:tRNA A-37 threonylcarbamoyl transferase component Bud32
VTPFELGFDQAKPLTGGLMNHVWRVWRGAQTFVFKYAPPHMAADPGIELSPDRLGFEAWALERAVQGHGVRPPRLVDQGPDWLLMEDLGPLPTLDAVLTAGRNVDLKPLGRYIRELHDRNGPDNADIQRVRLEVQYRPLGLEGFGRRLCEPGTSFIHGDLWPRSVLVGDEGLFLIDWEFCHQGRPCQDVGHLLAHLWMLNHVHGIGEAPMMSFMNGYGHDDQPDGTDTVTHMAAEILARSEGPFVRGYLYDGKPGLAGEAIARGRDLLVRHPR